MPRKELDPERVIFWRDVGKLTWAAIGRVMTREVKRKAPFGASAVFNCYKRHKENFKPRHIINGEQATLLRRYNLTYRKIGELLAESLGRKEPFAPSAVYEAAKRFRARRAAQKSTEAAPSDQADKPNIVRRPTATPAVPAQTRRSEANTSHSDRPR